MYLLYSIYIEIECKFRFSCRLNFLFFRFVFFLLFESTIVGCSHIPLTNRTDKMQEEYNDKKKLNGKTIHSTVLRPFL